MIRLLLPLLLVSGIVVAGEPAPKPKPKVEVTLQNVNQVAELIIRHQDAFIAKSKDREYAIAETRYWRYISWHASSPEVFRNTLPAAEWWLNNMHFATSRVEWREVPGSAGQLKWFDLREPGWNEAAWSAVANRDLTFREPQLDTALAEKLRYRAGAKRNADTLSAEVVVWGPQLFRDSVETQRSPTYYDLLFSEFRYPSGDTPTPELKPVEATKGTEFTWREEHRVVVSENGGDLKYPDDTDRVWAGTVKGSRYGLDLKFKVFKNTKPVEKPQVADIPKSAPAKFVDFPATEDDWEAVFKIQRGKAQPKAFGRKTELRYLAVVAGMHDDEKRGSVVAFKNRLLELADGQFGPNLETYDVENGTAKQDFIEQSFNITKGERPQYDAQERLSGLPAGGQACFLNNGKGKRIETAAAKVARGIPEKKNQVFIHSPEVRNPGDCVRCHAPTYGVIDPQDMVKELILDKDGRGVADINFKDPADLVNFKGAFRELKKRNEGWRTGYRELLEEATEHLEKPWTGVQLVEAYEGLWNWYDTPVDIKQAARELGCTEDVIKKITDETLIIRSRQLQRGQRIPRNVWDKDVRPLFWKYIVERRQE